MADHIAHPDEATWERLALGEVEPPERDAIFDHVTACESCSRIWHGLRALEAGAQAEGLIPAGAPARLAWLRSPAVYLALAATLTIITSGVVMMNRWSATDQDLSGDRSAMRSTGGALVEQLSTESSNGIITFAWAPVTGASGYRVSVFSDDGLTVWTRETAVAPLAWPAEVPRNTGAYRWRVEALAGGGVLATSRLASIEIAR